LEANFFRNIFPSEGYQTHRGLAGGDINQVFHVSTSQGEFVVKVNSALKFPMMFELEKEGLQTLNNNSEFRVPDVHSQGEFDDNSYLAMEYIQPSRGSYPDEQAGQFLASMHLKTTSTFGLDRANYIGSLSQSNKQHTTWSDFFTEERLLPLISRNKHYFNKEELSKFKQLFAKFDTFFPTEPPSLLHGDLWSGNTFSDLQNRPVLIDPAIYYGHRLMDLGMTKLFGGFGPRFYDSYKEVNRLESNWNEAVEVANLYPLLVHLELFGSGYRSQIITILNRYY